MDRASSPRTPECSDEPLPFFSKTNPQQPINMHTTVCSVIMMVSAKTTSTERKHNERCSHSKHKVCKCQCGGKLHGKTFDPERFESEDSKLMTEEMGGEVAQFIESMKYRLMRCWCTTELVCRGFYGYPHENGLPDKDGNKWWLSLHCDKCGYDWSAWKVENRSVEKVKHYLSDFPDKGVIGIDEVDLPQGNLAELGREAV